MRLFSLAISFILIASIFVSCKPYCQCEPVMMPEFTVKIINVQGQNLVSGPQALYKADSVKVLKRRNDFSVHNAAVSRWYSDTTLLSFDFYLPETKSFIYYNQQSPSDSLEINWVDKKGRCCGDPFTYHSIQEVRFNGTVVQPQNGIYTFVK